MLFRSYLVASRRRCFSLLKARSNQIPSPVQLPVVFPGVSSVGLGRNDGFCSLVMDEGEYSIAFVPLVGDDTPSIYSSQQGYGLGNIRSLTTSEGEAHRLPLGIGHHVYLGAQSSTGPAHSLTLAPPLPHTACWWVRIMVGSIITYRLSGSSNST